MNRRMWTGALLGIFSLWLAAAPPCVRAEDALTGPSGPVPRAAALRDPAPVALSLLAGVEGTGGAVRDLGDAFRPVPSRVGARVGPGLEFGRGPGVLGLALPVKLDQAGHYGFLAGPALTLDGGWRRTTPGWSFRVGAGVEAAWLQGERVARGVDVFLRVPVRVRRGVAARFGILLEAVLLAGWTGLTGRRIPLTHETDDASGIVLGGVFTTGFEFP